MKIVSIKKMHEKMKNITKSNGDKKDDLCDGENVIT